jgi:hypothetical protein
MGKQTDELVQMLISSLSETLGVLAHLSDAELDDLSEHPCAMGGTERDLLTHNIDHEQMHAGQIYSMRYSMRKMQKGQVDRLMAETIRARANLIAARAYLERYRESAASEDLTNARDHLRSLSTAGFSPTERVEYVIGLGEALFFDGAPGAAAAIFGAVLSGPDYLSPAARDGLLDWWASAIDRDARRQPDIERRAMYQKVIDRMEIEVGANPASAAASYWLAAAAWGRADLPTAWDAALAAWVRSGLTIDEHAHLRGDIDQLMLRGIIPDRAKATAQPVDVLRAEWDRFKERWTK